MIFLLAYKLMYTFRVFSRSFEVSYASRFVPNHDGLRLLEEWQGKRPCRVRIVLPQKPLSRRVHDLRRPWGVHQVLKKIPLFLQWCVFSDSACYVYICDSYVNLYHIVLYCRYQVPKIDYAYGRPKFLRLSTESYCKRRHVVRRRRGICCISKVGLQFIVSLCIVYQEYICIYVKIRNALGVCMSVTCYM